MNDKKKLDMLIADAEEMASVVASAPHDQRAILRVVTKSVVLGAQIARQCSGQQVATDQAEKDAS